MVFKRDNRTSQKNSIRERPNPFVYMNCRLSRIYRMILNTGMLVCFCTAVTGTAQEDSFILGADISWIQEREANGVEYADNGEVKDIFEILKDHGFNWIRLRLFVDPTAEVPGEDESPYSTEGFCDLEHTRQMAQRISDAGMKFLLDFHYSDTWADPGKQHKPVSWEGLSFRELEDTVRGYTREVSEKFEQDGNLPDMVQVGNEIVGGMIWPDGRISNMSNFAALVNAGIDGVKDVDPEIRIMIHSISENSPSSWLSNLINAGVNRIDVFGLSYYSEWHGTPDDLNDMLTEVAQNHNVKIAVAEYADNHERVNDIVYNLPENKGIGTFVWEPADWMDALFDWTNGRRETNERIDIYPELAAEYGNVDIKQSDPLPQFSGDKNTPGISLEGILRYNSGGPSTAEISLVTLRGRVIGDWSVSGKGRYNIETNLSDSDINQGIYLLIVERPGYKRRVYSIGLTR